MTKSKKKTIRDHLTDVSPYELEGKLTDLRDRLDKWIEDHGPTAQLDWDAHFHHDYEVSPSPRYNIVLDREETDEEYEKRITKETRDKALRETQERVEYERLQKKFAGKK